MLLDLLLEKLVYVGNSLEAMAAADIDIDQVRLEPGDLIVSKKAFGCAMQMAGLMWIYDGEASSRRPHAKLASGMCSNGYLDVGSLIKGVPWLRRFLAHDLITTSLLHWEIGIDWVVGADTSSTALAGDIAEFLSPTVKHGLMAKQPDKSQLWLPDQENIIADEWIMQVEELVTTAHSAMKVREAIARAHPGVEYCYEPVVMTIVDRSDPSNPVAMIGESELVSLFRYPISNFEPADCPYCAAGSPALTPKDHRDIFFGRAV